MLGYRVWNGSSNSSCLFVLRGCVKEVTTLAERVSGRTIDDAVAQEPTSSDDPVETVSISRLLPAVDAPRLNGENAEHVEMLASSDAAMPPILVHRRSLRVVDGSHRLMAAKLRGERTIRVVYFDGSDEEAFVAAVKANTTHGLPLSIADRKAAATRILRGYPDWSDRVIAKVAGLTAKTVAAIRPTEEAQQLDGRLGADGRVRPINASTGRLRAAEVIRSRPGASLREIARAAGVSPTTARDVRDRLQRGATPTIPDKLRRRPPAARGTLRGAAGGTSEPVTDPMEVLRRLRRDPSLRQTEAGRTLLRRLDMLAWGLADYLNGAAMIPPHCLYALIELAHTFATGWRAQAEELQRRLSSTVG